MPSFQISADLARRVRTETAQIQHYAATDMAWGSHQDRNFAATLANRRIKLQEAGLFYADPGVRERPNWTALARAQAEIARVHGLRLQVEGNRSKWVAFEGELPDDELATRRPNKFQEMMQSVDRRRLPRIDAALLAHAYQIPIALFEAPMEASFDAFINRALRGQDLFSDPFDLLASLARDDATLSIVHASEASVLFRGMGVEPTKGVVVLDGPVADAEVSCNTPLIAHSDLTALFGNRSVYSLFLARGPAGAAKTVVDLVSTSRLTAGRLDQSVRVFFPPERVLSSDRAHELKFFIDERGEYEFLLIASREDLSDLPAYLDSGSTRIGTPAWPLGSMTSEDDAWLRRLAFRLGSEGLIVLHRRLLASLPGDGEAALLDGLGVR